MNAASVASMLASKGQSVTLTIRTSGAYDPATGTATITETTQTISGAILPLSAFRKANDGNIALGDQQLLLSALDTSGAAVSPKVDSSITDTNGNVWTLTAVEPLAPDGTDLVFDCVIRRAA